MFSDKTRKYKIADSKVDFLKKFGSEGQYVEKFLFDEVIFIKEDNDIYAFKNKCPHQGAKLNGCWIKEEKVICPLHQYKFDVENGRGHGLYLETYPLEQNEDGLFLLRTYFSWFGE
jgi:3-phenylpropionate/trans-cinnamate dioxygenase ferredoxin subunit